MSLRRRLATPGGPRPWTKRSNGEAICRSGALFQPLAPSQEIPMKTLPAIEVRDRLRAPLFRTLRAGFRFRAISPRL
jgi:hypothetical protein